MAQYVLNLTGQCTSCEADIPQTETVTCGSCEKVFHALCPSAANRKDNICNATFLKLWHASSTKANFKWYCDICLTDMETTKSSSLENVVHTLVTKVSELTNEVQKMKQSEKVSPVPNQPSGLPTVIHGGAWADPKSVQNLRASLVIKPNDKKDQVNLETIRKIVVDNNIPVSKVGVSTSGNTFIHCPSIAARDKLQPLLESDIPNQTVHSLKEKLPSISIVDITEKFTKEELVTRIRQQNSYVNELIDQDHIFKVLFMKPPTGEYKNYQVVALVSPDIRDVISANRNRLFVGLESCRVYDRFYVKRCNECNCFGHYKAKCPNKASCTFCASEEHNSETCPLKDSRDHSKFKCINCKRSGLSCEGHSAAWFKCPAYIIAQKKIQSTIPYYEGLKNRNHHPVS